MQINLTEQQEQQLERLSEQQGIDVAALIRHAIDVYIQSSTLDPAEIEARNTQNGTWVSQEEIDKKFAHVLDPV